MLTLAESQVSCAESVKFVFSRVDPNFGGLVAAVPVKALRDAKSRLDVDNRGTLAVRMLEHVLAALTGSGVLATVGVVSPDPAVLEMAVQWGATPVQQLSGGLNDACALAASWALRRGARGLLVAHADLPRLCPDDVRRMVSCASLGRGIVLAPDRHGTGSNMLLATPPDAVRFAFGPDSRRLHRDGARRAGLAVCEFFSAGTSSDVDTARDLAESLA